VSADRRFDAAIEAIDAANAGDPATLLVRSETRPKEQAHAELMTEWVRTLDPSAGDAQLLAARAHHLRRWSIPRHDYPDGRAGYLRWRAALQRQHASEVADILRGVGYDDGTIDDVQRIIRKEGLRAEPRDAAVQTHEDALCLVFLETQCDALVDDLGDERAIDVLRKTAVKMSERGIAAASSLALSDRSRALLVEALSTG
jgi:hypothetical protein